MAYQVKIHPLDFEPNVAIGVGLPIFGADNRFKLNYLTLDQAVTNAKNLLLTNTGERVMQPLFGCDLRKTLFENLSEETIEGLEERIREAFAYWLPYIFINELTLTPDYDYNKLAIKLSISLVGNKFDTRSIQLEVNLERI
jgi:phage baseplate assembly protein W